jgi:hypothetical protein
MVEVILVTTPSVDGNQVSVTKAILTACPPALSSRRENTGKTPGQGRGQSPHPDNITYTM